MHERETVETFDEVLKQNNKEKWFKVNKQATIDWSKTTSHFVGHDKAGEELSRKILTRMKMSAKAVNEISSIVGLHMKMHELPEMKKPHSIRKLIANPFFELTFNLSLSDTVGTVRDFPPTVLEEINIQLAALKAATSKWGIVLPEPDITGDDLIQAGAKPGPLFKKALDIAFNQQLDGVTDKHKLLSQALSYISTKDKNGKERLDTVDENW